MEHEKKTWMGQKKNRFGNDKKNESSHFSCIYLKINVSL